MDIKLKEQIKKVPHLIIVMLMIFGCIFSNVENISAQTYTGPFTRVKEIKYPSWWADKIPGVKNWSTWMCTYNGQWSYCLEASKNTPANGSYAATVIDNNPMVKKLLYYGFGGPGQCVFKNETDEMAYLYTHVLLCYAYSGDLCGADLNSLESLGIGLKNVYQYISDLPEPVNVSLDGNNTGHFTASFDLEKKEQKTNTTTFKAATNATLNVVLQDNVTLHNMTKGTSGTGIVRVYGGDTFYLTAPMTVTGNFTSENIAGNNCTSFVPLAIGGGSGIQTHGSYAKDTSLIKYTVNWMDTGAVEIKKTNTTSDLIDGAVFNLKSISYDGWDNNVTVTDGKIKVDNLPIGTYELKEIQAPDGYLINKTVYTVTVNKNQITSQTIINEEPTGSIDLTKEINLNETSEMLGDAYLKDNEYTLYAKADITNKAGTKIYFKKGAAVDKQSTDKNGKIKFDNLYVGKYQIKETKSNDALVLNPEIINIDIEYEGQNISKIIKSNKTSNRVNMQKIQVFKSGEKDRISGLVKGLQGAEFTFKLKSEVEHVGWDKAVTYAKIITDKDGKANTPFLPYGQYLVKETVTPKDYITAPDFLISVSDDYTEYEDIQQIKRVNINNRPFTSQVKLIKVDKDTEKAVTLNSATFKIKDSDGNYVTQKIGGKKYDTFTTNSKNQITVLFGNKGEVTLPLALDAGKYTIEEVKTPQGFLVLEESVHFTITNQYDYDVDEDKDPIITIKVKNEQPKGKIILKKTDKVTADPLEKVEYELTAKEDIINAIDGSILFKKGNLVAKGITNADGQVVIDDLFMGHYELKEVLTNEGYVLSEEVHDVVFEQKDLTTKEYVMNFDVTNIAPKGEIHLVKADKDSEELLSGVIYLLTAKEDIYSLDGRNTLIYKAGDTVSKDISQDGYYMTNELGEINISNLPLGKYQLKEITPLEGYYTDKTEYEIDLSYDHSDKVIYTKTLNVTNTKSTVEISKVDTANSKELEGAHLSLYDKNNNLIGEWISTNEPHIIRGLKINEEYRLHEDFAPLGYATASDITFIVTDDTVTKVTMKDEITKIDISKVDATTGKEIEGAKLTVTDKETGEVIDNWTSAKEPHHIIGLTVGKTYILHEELAPQGYLTANDVEFTVLDSGEVQKVVMKDELAPVVVQTGDSSHVELYAILAVLSLGTAALYTHLKKKKGNDSDE